MVRYCTFCNTNHEASTTFWRIRGGYYQCKKKIAHQQKKKRMEHPERYKQYMDRYYKNNKEKVIARNYLYASNRRLQDKVYNLSIVLRQRFYRALKGNYKIGSAVADLGCSLEEFKTYIESKFKPGMSWDNHTRSGWHLDHVIPLSSFDLTDPKQVKQALHHTNLQPLWAEENLRKGNRTKCHLVISIH